MIMKKMYVYIDGKKYNLVEENNEPELCEFPSDLSELPEDFNHVQVGYGAVDDKLKSKCLVLSNAFEWSIIPNPADHMVHTTIS